MDSFQIIFWKQMCFLLEATDNHIFPQKPVWVRLLLHHKRKAGIEPSTGSIIVTS